MAQATNMLYFKFQECKMSSITKVTQNEVVPSGAKEAKEGEGGKALGIDNVEREKTDDGVFTRSVSGSDYVGIHDPHCYVS